MLSNMENNSDSKVRTLTPNSGDAKSSDKAVEINYESLRLLPVAVLDNMLDYIYSNNKEAFDMYFDLIRIKEVNKLTPKKATSSQGTKEASLIPNTKNDKLER